MNYALFIDDERNPMDVKWGSWQDQALYRDGDWVIARNWFEVLEIVVSLGFPNVISFDHDLGENEFNGLEISKKLGDMVLDGMDFPMDFIFRVHSKNPVGAENIQSFWISFMKHWFLQNCHKWEN